MPSELKQRLEFALRAAERVMQGRSLAQSEESYLERRGAQVIRLNNEVTVRFTPDALPIPPSTR